MHWRICSQREWLSDGDSNDAVNKNFTYNFTIDATKMNEYVFVFNVQSYCTINQKHVRREQWIPFNRLKNKMWKIWRARAQWIFIDFNNCAPHEPTMSGINVCEYRSLSLYRQTNTSRHRAPRKMVRSQVYIAVSASTTQYTFTARDIQHSPTHRYRVNGKSSFSYIYIHCAVRATESDVPKKNNFLRWFRLHEFRQLSRQCNTCCTYINPFKYIRKRISPLID